MRMVNGTLPNPSTDETMTTGTLEKYLPAEKLRGVPSATPRRYPSGTVWPHGEWSLGYASEVPNGGDWHEDPYVGLGVDDVGMAQRSEQGRTPLNLSDAPNSHSRPRRGQNGITGYGQQMIKACGFLMGERWPRHRKTLGTITLPPMSAAARRAVVELWPELTRQLLQWLTRQLERQGLPPVACSVTEVQPKRLEAQNEACLHWHLLWLNRPGKAGNWAIDPCDVRAWLSELLLRKVPSYQGEHVNVNVKAVEGEAARYLAKYMSKGRQQVAKAMEDWGEDICPRTWWNMTKAARDMVKSRTHKGRAAGALLDSIVEYAWCTDIDMHFEFFRPIMLEFDGVEVTVGWRGRFTDSLRCDVRAMLESDSRIRFLANQKGSAS